MSARPTPHKIPFAPRPVGWLGLASVAVILLGAVAAALAYAGPSGEAYSPLNHFISELGQLSQSRLALAFDAGVVAGGLGLAAFLTILSRHLTGRFGTALLVMGLVSGGSGMLVGVFPMDTHALHRFVSGAFFLTGWSVAAIFSLWLLARPRPGFPTWPAALGGICTPIFAAFVAVHSAWHPADPDAPILDRPTLWIVPLLEWASLLSLLVWVAVVSLVLVRRDSWPES